MTGRPRRRAALTVALALAASVFAMPTSPADAGTGAGRDARFDSMARRISVSMSHTCVVTDEGEVSCWGWREFGRLGYGTATQYETSIYIGDNENPSNIDPVTLPGWLPAVAVTTGAQHTCALLTFGQVSCWGLGIGGRLGYGNTVTVGLTQTPASVGAVALPGGLQATAIDAGDEFTCALLVDGRVSCWGRADVGQLGRGSTETIGDNETPASAGTVALPGGQRARAITAGSSHACALLQNGQVSCWGFGGSGVLGYGNTTTIGNDETPATAGTVALPGGQTAVAVAAGSAHTCAILASGAVSCWGDGASGRLGYGNTTDIGDTETPASAGTVPLPGGQTAVAITAGFAHTCAVLANGLLSCWGDGDSGRLGYGNTIDIGDTETAAAAGTVPLPAGQGAVAVDAGVTNTCAILANGQVSCWGDGTGGRLGVPFRGGTPIGDDETPAGERAVQLPGARTVMSASAGKSHTCAVLSSGQVSCWGQGFDGRLGYARTENIGDLGTFPASAGSVALPGGQTAVSVSAGDSHTCALLADGRVSCWGSGVDGALGYGNPFNRGDNESPASAGTVALPGGRRAVAVEAGGTHTCAVLDNGQVSCWGRGVNGQLGYGNQVPIGDNETPASAGTVPLPGGQTAVAVTVGFAHTCALLASGQVSCWGAGSRGRLGYGNTTSIGDNETPASVGTVALPGGQKAIDIDAGSSHTCALLASGQVSCWGLGDNGKLGYGNVSDIGDNETPASAGTVAMPGGRTAIEVSAGEEHTCATFTDEKVACWGKAVSGQLGYGNIVSIGDNETPAANAANGGVVQIQLVRSVTAGGNHTCALATTTGALTCWGTNASGQLGAAYPTVSGDDEAPGSNGSVNVPNPLRPRDISPLNPRRLADTRPSAITFDGLYSGAGIRPAGTTYEIIVGGRAGVPPHATAALLSIAAVSPSLAGFVTAYPCDQPRPTAANMNYQPGATTANSVLAKLSGDGKVCVFTNQATHLVVDLNGSTTGASAIVAVNPARLADTRPGFTTIDGQVAGIGRRNAGTTLTLAVAGRGGVPASGRTVALNVSAANPGANGFVTVFPCGQPVPLAASLNYRTGVTTANFVYATTADDGTICLFTNQATDLVVDVVAHHLTGAPVPTRHHPVLPSRLVDTRAGQSTVDGRFAGIGQRAANSTLTLPIAGRYPAGAARLASVSISAVDPTANGFVTAYPCDQPRPTAATFNFRAGATRAVGALVTLSAWGTVCIFTNQATHLVVDVNGTTL